MIVQGLSSTAGTTNEGWRGDREADIIVLGEIMHVQGTRDAWKACFSQLYF